MHLRSHDARARDWARGWAQRALAEPREDEEGMAKFADHGFADSGRSLKVADEDHSVEQGTESGGGGGRGGCSV